MLIIPLCTAVWQPTPAAIRRSRRLAAVLHQHGVKYEYAASVMGLSFTDFCDQLACRKPLNFYRLADLFEKHPELEDAYEQAGLESRGWRVMKDAVLVNLVDAVQESVGLVKELTTKRRMVKASLELQAETRRRA